MLQMTCPCLHSLPRLAAPPAAHTIQRVYKPATVAGAQHAAQCTAHITAHFTQHTLLLCAGDIRARGTPPRAMAAANGHSTHSTRRTRGGGAGAAGAPRRTHGGPGCGHQAPARCRDRPRAWRSTARSTARGSRGPCGCGRGGSRRRHAAGAWARCMEVGPARCSCRCSRGRLGGATHLRATDGGCTTRGLGGCRIRARVGA